MYVRVVLGTTSFCCAVEKLIMSGCLGSTFLFRIVLLVVFISGSARFIHSLIFLFISLSHSSTGLWYSLRSSGSILSWSLYNLFVFRRNYSLSFDVASLVSC